MNRFLPLANVHPKSIWRMEMKKNFTVLKFMDDVVVIARRPWSASFSGIMEITSSFGIFLQITSQFKIETILLVYPTLAVTRKILLIVFFFFFSHIGIGALYFDKMKLHSTQHTCFPKYLESYLFISLAHITMKKLIQFYFRIENMIRDDKYRKHLTI